MKVYALKLKMPKNTRLYFNYFKRVLLDRCEKMRADCVVEMIDGRIIVFTDSCADKMFEGIRGYVSHYPVEIFEDFEELVREVVKRLKNCKSFAIRSNKKSVENELGARVIENMRIEVNLRDAECKIYVERRGKFYLLFSQYP